MGISDWFGGASNNTAAATGQPGSVVTGGSGSLGSITNALEGDPASLVAALNNLMKTAYARGDQTKNFLLGREANAEQYYRPMQQMFGNMYGSGGLMPAKAPGVPGSGGSY